MGDKKKGAKERGITRREFLKTTAVSGATVVTSSMIPSVVKRSHAASKTARMLLIPSPKITPGHMTAGNEGNVASLIYDWLFRLEGPEQKFVNSLAESTEHSKDMTKYTIKLREKVKFHHGTELTADDVVFTVNRWLDPNLGSPVKPMFSNLDKVETAGRYLVRFTLKKPDPDFLLKFLEYNAAILAHDYDYNQLGNTKPSGTGAFKVVSYSPGQRMLLERNPSYFIQGLPKLDNFEIITISDMQTQIMALEANQADIIRMIGIQYVSRYKSHPDINLQSLELAYHLPITMRCDQPPFNDNRVRQAMKLVVDRKKMLESVAYGYGVLANDNHVWPKNRWYADIGMKEQNIEQAKELLAKAGYPKGLDVEIYTSSNLPPSMENVITYQEMAKPAGINVSIRGFTRDIYEAKYWRNVNLCCTNWGHRENPIDLLSLALRSNAPWNEGHYVNPDLDKLIDDASMEIDSVKRRELFKKIEILLSEDGPSILPFFYNTFAAVRKNVTGFQLTRNWINDYRFVQVG